MKTVSFLALPNCMESSISAPYEILSLASRQWHEHFATTETDLFKLSIVTKDGNPVSSFSGMNISPNTEIADSPPPHIIFIPVLFGDRETAAADHELCSWLRACHAQGTIICAVCAGVFMVAQSGLLNGRSATTHWNLAAEFSNRYPQVVLKKERMIIDEGDIITAGGVTAFIDLALYMVGRFGSPELATTLSKRLLIDPARQLQTPYFGAHFNTTHQDEKILKVQRWMAENLTECLSIALLAGEGGLGERTFARRFKKATGDTPLEYLQSLRIAKARSLLETTSKPVEAILATTGYTDMSSFRKLFKRSTGMTPAAYRKKFGINR